MSDFVAALVGVSQSYGKVKALDDVSLTLPAGQMVGLVGPDGVGKSTLLALIAGVRRLQTGSVQALGGDISDKAHRAACASRIAYMPQGLGRNLYPTLSVYENLDFFGRLFGQGAAERAARIAELLAATGLAPFPDRPAGQLSGGMKQKLSLCCALIHDPDLLILDEPTTGVDPLSRRQFWELIERMRARRPQMSVVVATAYMEEAERFDWLAALYAGKIIGAGAPAEILAKTGEATLDAAFIALLPAAARADHTPIVLPPLAASGEGYAIEAENLTCRFGKFTAVDHVSFQIRRGEIFGFLGSNGCGKSTTMKMLTGLIAPSEGQARLFGEILDARDMATRQRVGYMSQSFSLYTELTVRQNLELHAELFELPAGEIGPRVEEMLRRFDLEGVAKARPESLPLGLRQRLQLAVAVIHRPEVLILDEPTSGVDPVARDSFWRLLIGLSRQDGVTIFISTHFMNEAERCDRISLMHAGKVLAVGAPAKLVAERGLPDLEQTFISYLEAAADISEAAAAPPAPRGAPTAARRFDLARLWAYARREAMEIARDPLRLAFALLGPLILMLTFGFGISFDVENLSYAVYDQDNTLESRELLESFSGSRYFAEKAEITSADEIDRRLGSGELRLAVEIPHGFGRDLVSGKTPEVAVWIDGAMPFRAETVRAYVAGLSETYAAEQARRRGLAIAAEPINVETRFRYNQAFKSVYSIIPGVIMLILMLIPAMATSVGVVREKEVGSIANFRSTPVTAAEFLIGKQAPYLLLFALSFALLLIAARLVFGLPVRGSALALCVGAALYIYATCSLGVLVSSFVSTQVAALFITAVVSIIPTVNFSGLLVPVSSLSTGGQMLGLAFPSAWFQEVSVGAFTKGLGFAVLWPDLLALAAFGALYQGLAIAILRKQEA